MRDRLFRLRPVFLALFAVLLFLPLSAPAQTQTPPAADNGQVASDSPAAQGLAQLAESRRRLEAMQAEAEAARDDDERLATLKAEVDGITREVVKVSVDLRPRMEQIRARLTELGDPPAEGQPAEAAIVTEERQRLTAERAEINAVTGEAENLSIAAGKLVGDITERRRTLFTETLFRRIQLSGDALHDARLAFSQEISALADRVGSWISFSWQSKQVQLLSAILLSLAAALLFLSGGYRLLGRLIVRNPALEDPPYMSRLSAAFWSTIIRSAGLAAFLVSSYFFLDAFNVLRADLAPILTAAINFIGLVYFVWRLTRAAFSPDLPNWRLAPLSNGGARDLSIAVLLMAAINGLDYFLGVVSVQLSSPVVLTVARSLTAAFLIGLILIAMSFFKPLLAKDGDPAETGRPWPRWAAFFLRFLGIALIFAVLTGYIGLARFASTQIVLTGAVLATTYIGILSGRAVSQRDNFAETAAGRYLAERYGLGPVALDQVGLAAGLGIHAFALAFGLPLIFLSWGFRPEDLEQWAYRLATEITIGNITISLIGIFGGVVLFLAGLAITRWVQRWIDGNVLERSHVEAGLRNSVKTGIGYLGVGVAGLIGISAAGINLSSLALVAGALSLGVGFGLQNIVSNFVSGLILLAERPFKVGDWVVTGTTEGFVKRISVRATEIETFQRQTIIVPNSELINGRVGNWTHRNKLGRADVPVGVGYNADPRRVMELLMEIGRAHPRVLRNPEPLVLFQGFGASSLDFELRVFLGDVLSGGIVKNELRLTIIERFREEGISIPAGPAAPTNIRILEPEPPQAPEPEEADDSAADGEARNDEAPDNAAEALPEGGKDGNLKA